MDEATAGITGMLSYSKLFYNEQEYTLKSQ